MRKAAKPILAAAVAACVVVVAIVVASRGTPERRAAGRPADRSAPTATTRILSDERTFSRWAYVRNTTVARAGPIPGSRAITRLRTQTSDRTPELVLALAETRRRGGSRWVRVRLPMRPNNRTGWVPRRTLGRYYVVTTFLRIDRRRLRAALFDRGDPVWTARVAVGTAAAPTPPGRFYVRSRIVPTDTSGTFGVFAFGTNGYSPGLSDWPGGGVVGIHGTNRPKLIPGWVSHGCVRVRNGPMGRLRSLMPLGTPIEIR